MFQAFYLLAVLSMKIYTKKMRCYCHSGRPYANCCEPYVTQTSYPKLAVQLMRSRYSAFCLHQFDYLEQTSIEQMSVNEPVDWVKLSIIKTNKGKVNDLVGTVEFKAFYLDEGSLFVLHEDSHFVKKEGRWFYAFGHHSIAPIEAEQI